MPWFVATFEKQILQRIFTFSQNTEKYRSRVSALQFSHRVLIACIVLYEMKIILVVAWLDNIDRFTSLIHVVFFRFEWFFSIK